MTLFGKAISGVGNKLGHFGKNLGATYGKTRSIAMEVGQAAHKGLDMAHNLANQADTILGKAQNIVDKGRGIPIIGTAASLLGGGIAQARNVVKIGNKGVEGLEKTLKATEGYANAVDKGIRR